LRRHWLRLQISFESTGLFASKLAPTKSSTPTTTVGASLLAKAMVRVPNMFWMYRPLREQARSHRVVCISQNCGSKLACEGNGPGSKYVLDVLASSRASSLPQSRVHFTKFWEQACLRRQWSGFQICFGCTGLFASKLAPTESCAFHKTVGASLLARAMARVPNILDVLASSRASSLPQSRVHFTKFWEQACLRRQWSGFQICFGCTGLFASKLAPTKSSTPTKTVGASLLAKALVEAPNMFWMYRPLREQARSHRAVCISQNCGSKLACEGNGPGSRYVLDVLASSRASSLPQNRVHQQKLWEQACLRRHWLRLQICFESTGLFASKLAPTKSSTPTKTVGASLLAKAMARAPNMFWMYWPLREQARSHRVVCISQNCGSKLACEGNGPGSKYVLGVLAYSRASRNAAHTLQQMSAYAARASSSASAESCCLWRLA